MADEVLQVPVQTEGGVIFGHAEIRRDSETGSEEIRINISHRGPTGYMINLIQHGLADALILKVHPIPARERSDNGTG